MLKLDREGIHGISQTRDPSRTSATGMGLPCQRTRRGRVGRNPGAWRFTGRPRCRACGLVEEIIKPHARDAVKVLIVANEFLEAQVRELQAAVSHGYARGKFEPAPRDRKDWFD
jgi:hypothetical protein